MPVYFQNHNKDVVLATVLSYDPEFKLNGAEIQMHFGQCNTKLAKTEDLVQSRKNCNTNGNAEKIYCMAFNVCTCLISCLYHYLYHVNALCVNSSFCYFLCRLKRYMDDYMGA